MVKKFVTISLATKFRLLFGTAVLGIIAAALVVPWYFMELMAEREAQRAGAELTRMRLNEFVREHPRKHAPPSRVAALYTAGGADQPRRGPLLIKLGTGPTAADQRLDFPARDALRAFVRNVDQDLAVIGDEDDRGQTVYRCFRAVRVEPTCASCHGPPAPVERQFQQGQLVGMIDVTVPGPAGTNWLVWWTRVSFLVGVVLAGIVASVVFAVIAQRLILRPVHHLRTVTDRAAEGDLDVRSKIQSGDEMQRLGESFNDMLAAIEEQQEKLKAANRALDLKLNELAEANVTLYQANRVKSEFLANVSHELRTPLNSIIGFADLLGGSGEERIRRYGANIDLAAKNLLSMINDLLDLAKIEAGKAEVRFDKASVSEICRTLLALMGPLANQKQLALESAIAEDLPMMVTDAGKLQQVLYNLLSNAIKFTPAGGKVTLSARCDGAAANGAAEGCVVISVADTGPGIPEAEQQHIFEKFYRSEATLTKESSGTGLGLAIARELTGLLRGRLVLESSPGHGTEFILFLPLDVQATQSTAVRGDGI